MQEGELRFARSRKKIGLEVTCPQLPPGGRKERPRKGGFATTDTVPPMCERVRFKKHEGAADNLAVTAGFPGPKY